jgi:hypothetical protein
MPATGRDPPPIPGLAAIRATLQVRNFATSPLIFRQSVVLLIRHDEVRERGSRKRVRASSVRARVMTFE